MSLSVVINTKNSAETLVKALESVSFADEIIVVDMASTDDTLTIAKKYTKHVFDHPDVGFVEPARNFALSKATQDWILILDSDEEVTPALQEVIQQISQPEQTPKSRVTVKDIQPADCYYLPRKNIIFGQWVKTGWWPDYILRLFRAGHVEWSDEIHSIPVTTGQVAELPADPAAAIIHHNYQTIDQFLDRLNRYTSIEADQSAAVKPSSADIWSAFSREFIRRAFADRGLADGQHGMTLALFQSLYQVAVLTKQWQQAEFGLSNLSKTQEQEQVIQQLTQFQAELRYWIADWQVEHSSGLAQLYWKLRRKLKL